MKKPLPTVFSTVPGALVLTSGSNLAAVRSACFAIKAMASA